MFVNGQDRSDETFGPLPTITGLKNVTFTRVKFVGMVEGEKCANLHFIDCTVDGGQHNLVLRRSTDCTVERGVYSNPVGTVTDPEDPEGHNVQFDRCERCSVVDAKLVNPAGDAANVFNGIGCVIDNIHVEGPLPTKGRTAIIDGPGGSGNVIKNIPDAVGLSITGGSRNQIRDSHADSVAITGEYYPGGRVLRPYLIGVTGNEFYWDPATVQNLRFGPNTQFARIVRKEKK